MTQRRLARMPHVDATRVPLVRRGDSTENVGQRRSATVTSCEDLGDSLRRTSAGPRWISECNGRFVRGMDK